MTVMVMVMVMVMVKSSTNRSCDQEMSTWMLVNGFYLLFVLVFILLLLLFFVPFVASRQSTGVDGYTGVPVSS